MAIVPALRWRKWGCGRPYRQAFFVPEQLCGNAAPAQPFLCRGTLFPFAAQKNVPAHFFVFDKKGCKLRRGSSSPDARSKIQRSKVEILAVTPL